MKISLCDIRVVKGGKQKHYKFCGNNAISYWFDNNFVKQRKGKKRSDIKPEFFIETVKKLLRDGFIYFRNTIDEKTARVLVSKGFATMD